MIFVVETSLDHCDRIFIEGVDQAILRIDVPGPETSPSLTKSAPVDQEGAPSQQARKLLGSGQRQKQRRGQSAVSAAESDVLCAADSVSREKVHSSSTSVSGRIATRCH